MLVNREGFIPNESFDAMVRLVRLGIDLSVRARAAAKVRPAPRPVTQVEMGQREELVDRVEIESLGEEVKTLTNVREMIAKGEVDRASAALSKTEYRLQSLADETNTEASMLRILASVGSQMSAFVHEINSALGMAEGVEHSIERLIESETTSSTRRELSRALKAVSDLRRQLERQASYLVDINSPDARRRRSRISISSRFDTAEKLLARSAEKKRISIKNDIPPDLKSPPMFPAELTSIFTNLLTNAIKAAGEGGKIRATGRQIETGGVSIRLGNTGEK
jgi:signal transduction histidine kinase